MANTDHVEIFSPDELVNALVSALEAPQEESDGLRTVDLRTLLGWSEKRTRKALRKALAQGLITRTTVYIETISGLRVPVVAYRTSLNDGPR